MLAEVWYLNFEEVVEYFLVNDHSDHVGVVVNGQHRLKHHCENPKSIFLIRVTGKRRYLLLCDPLILAVIFSLSRTSSESIRVLHYFNESASKEVHALAVTNCRVALGINKENIP